MILSCFLSALVENTTVDIYHSNGSVAKSLQLLTALEHFDYDISPTEYFHISADHPIQVAQFAKSKQTGARFGDPFMTIQESIENFKSSSFAFTTMRSVEGSLTNTIHISIATADKHGLLLNGVPIAGSTWVDMETTDHSITRVGVPEGMHTLTHSDRKTFSAFLYGLIYEASYALPIQPMPHTYRFTAQARTLAEALMEKTPQRGEMCYALMHHFQSDIALAYPLKSFNWPLNPANLYSVGLVSLMSYTNLIVFAPFVFMPVCSV